MCSGPRVAEQRGRIYKVSVKRLVEQVLREGHIHFRFSSRNSAIEGIRGHQKVQASRDCEYQVEVSVKDVVESGEYKLEISGRADCVRRRNHDLTVEEIKTLRVTLDELPDSHKTLHWGQVQVYAYLLCREAQYQSVNIVLCYYNTESGEETRLERISARRELATFYDSLTSEYLAWLKLIDDWRLVRDASARELTFPFSKYRHGQRQLAVNTYRTAVNRQQLILQAPTGMGKTLGNLFPLVKAMAEGHCDKIFFLTAKTVGRMVAEESLDQMRSNGLRLKSVTLTAKEKICFNKGTPCDPNLCQYANGYYDRVKDALTQALQRHDNFCREKIEEIANEFQLCPFELSLDLCNWADCIIGDYNYAFDPSVYLRRFFDEPGDDYSFLIDEAHNLVDRGRDMFSATILKSEVLRLKRALAADVPDISLTLSRLNRSILAIRNEDREFFEANGHLVLTTLPRQLTIRISQFCNAAERWLAENQQSAFQSDLLQFYFDALRFNRTTELFDENYVLLLRKSPLSREGRELVLTQYCINPAKRLGEAFERASSSVLFSATLSPDDYYRTLWGTSKDARYLDLASPFPKDNLGVFVATHLSTSFRHRQATYASVTELIANVVSRKKGNYLVYFPSHRYLKEIGERFSERFPEVRMLMQQTQMNEEERHVFLSSFDPDNAATLVGFAVMGGIFGEAIDLKGDRLIGVIVVGVGLPQLSIERDLIREHFNDTGNGFEYAYQYPGMNRVLQTAGRVIRSEDDLGIVCLVDPRFASPGYRRLLPRNWDPTFVDSNEQLVRALDGFWGDSLLNSKRQPRALSRTGKLN